jgi:hypothetical protein
VSLSEFIECNDDRIGNEGNTLIAEPFGISEFIERNDDRIGKEGNTLIAEPFGKSCWIAW